MLLNLPLDVKVTKISWIAVWDLSEKVHYGYINISRTLKPPEEKNLEVFTVDHLGHHFHMDDIIIYNIKQILFVNVGYDGLKAGSSVWIGNGGLESPEWTKELFQKDRDLEFSTLQPLNITITLPGNLTVNDLDSVRIWIDEDQIFGHFIISDEDKENLPPLLQDLVEMKLCEVLLDEVYQVSWQLDEFNNKITLELTGRITLNEYMAFGISGSDKMVGSDGIVVWIDPTTSEPQAEDYHLSDNSKCIGNIGIDLCPDTFVSGGTNDAQLIGAVIRDGITTIRVSRPLTSDDSLDNPIQTDRRVFTFWSLGPKFKITSMSHSQLHTSGMREINFGMTEVSDCPDLELVEEEEKGNSFSKLFSDLSNNVAEEVPSSTDRHISKRNAGSPDPLADLVTNACCFTDCQNGGIGFATVDQQLQCVCPFPWTGPGCATITPCPGDIIVESNQALTTVEWMEAGVGTMFFITSRTAHSGDLFPVGMTEVIISYFNVGTNELRQCTFTVTITTVDTTNPQITCPEVDPVVIEIRTGGTIVTWLVPTATDLSPTSVTCTRSPGEFYTTGMTTVTCTAVDQFGNSNSCTFVVSVIEEDTIPPIISNCPDDISHIIELGLPSAVISWPEPSASDVSGTVTLSARSHDPGSSFMLGLTTVVYIFVDPTGNAATCSFMVNVMAVDTTPPTIEDCPSRLEGVVELGTSGAVMDWMEPSASDVSGVAMLVSRSHAPGSFFNVGTTQVSYTFTDDSGNEAVCAFIISITTG